MTLAMYQVLVVEDEPGIRAVLRALLEAEQYRVVEADTAERAEIEARSHKPGLLLVDLGLPDGDGVELIRRVGGFAPLPIVVLSARTMEEQKIAALDAGADDYVTKPFSAPELLAREAGALVTQRRLIREVWGPDRVDDSRNLRVVVRNLRQKLEPDPPRPRHIVTEAGVGYRLCAEPAAGS